jgi:hypothetical protein
MRFLRRHWYSVGLLWAVIAIAWALFGRLPTVQVILLLNFTALMLHQFEEYGWPGGLPWIMNEVGQPLGGPADRFPLNQNNALFINLVAYPLCLLPVFFPDALWLGLAMVLFTLGQFIVHGVVANLKLKSLYNPGLAAVVFAHLPLSIWYLVEIYSKGTVPLWNWALAAVYLGCFIGIVMKYLGYGILASKDSPYPFAPEEMERFNRSGNLARLANAGGAKATAG